MAGAHGDMASSQSNTTYSISSLAQEFEITTRTLRHYEDMGLLAPKRKGQARIFSAADRTKLLLILRGKRLGFTLEESRSLIELYDPAGSNDEQLLELLRRIQEKRAKLINQQCDLLAMMEDLERVEAGCREALRKKTKH